MCFEELETDNCTEFCDERAIIVAKEKKSEYCAHNKSSQHCCKMRIDDCFIKKGERCDFLILNCEKKTAFFIELKGADLRKSFRQINASIDKLLIQFKGFKMYARSVVTKVPSPALSSSEEKKLRKKLKNINGSKDKRKPVKYQTGKMEEDI